jgi:beta-catenin-like protein 1
MTDIDSLFRKPNLPSNKRKLDNRIDPRETYKAAKLTANVDVRGKQRATVEDDDDAENDVAGPELPPEDEEGPPEDDEEGRFFGGGINPNTAEAIEYLDENDKGDYVPEKIDAAWVRRLALNFEKRISKNAELRAKYEEEPQKFMSSEADLDADIKALSILSEHPEFYSEFANLGCIKSLVSLLSHENTDIAIDAIEIINELTDEDVEAEQEQWDVIVNAMLEADLLDLLAQNLDRFDENNDSDRSGVYYSLGILENLASQPSISNTIGQENSIITWLLKRIQVKEVPISQNKQYAAEVLAILLQSSPENRDRFVQLDGVDVCLQLLSAYRKRDPEKDSHEEEYVENLFDCLSCVVDEIEGKEKFVEAEGVELCLIMLREGRFSKSRSLKLLDHAIGGSNGRSVGEKIVEAAGLKTIFGMFMKKQNAQDVEHLLGIFAALLRVLPGESASRIRTLAKFVEKDYEKVTKILGLRREYASKLAVAEQQIEKERAGLGKEEQDDLSSEWLSRRLDAGLFCLQTIDVVLAWLIAEDNGAKVLSKKYGRRFRSKWMGWNP